MTAATKQAYWLKRMISQAIGHDPANCAGDACAIFQCGAMCRALLWAWLWVALSSLHRWGCHRLFAPVWRGIPPVDWLGPWQAIAVAIVAQYCDVSRANASHHPPLFADAVEWLCMQLRVVGEALAEGGNAVAEGNVLPLNPRALLVPGDLRGHTGQPIAPAQL